MTSSGFLTNGPAVQIADGESGAQDSSEIALASSTADTSISFASCSLAWCWQKRSSAADGSLARTRAAAPHRSHRSALVNSGVVKVAFMATPSGRKPLSQISTRLAVFTTRLPAVLFLTPVRLALRAGWRYGPPFGVAGAPVSHRRVVVREDPGRAATRVAYQRRIRPPFDG